MAEAVRTTHNQDGAIVLDIRQGEMFHLNLVGSRIVELMKTGSAEASIVEVIRREFGVERAQAQVDVHEFLSALERHALVEAAPEGETA